MFLLTVNCKTCWGASEGCCNTCDEVKEAYEAAKWEFNPHGLFQCSDTYLYNIHSRVGPGNTKSGLCGYNHPLWPFCK